MRIKDFISLVCILLFVAAGWVLVAFVVAPFVITFLAVMCLLGTAKITVNKGI